MFKVFEKKDDTTRGQKLSTTQTNFRVSYASFLEGNTKSVKKRGNVLRKRRKLNIEVGQLNLLKLKY